MGLRGCGHHCQSPESCGFNRAKHRLLGAERNRVTASHCRTCDRDGGKEVPAAAGEGEQKAHDVIMQVNELYRCSGTLTKTGLVSDHWGTGRANGDVSAGHVLCNGLVFQVFARDGDRQTRRRQR